MCVFVHSIASDGRSRAGVYCAANACIEQVIQHGEVDVFQAVKTVRRHRPQLIESMVNTRIVHSCTATIIPFNRIKPSRLNANSQLQANAKSLKFGLFMLVLLQTEYKYCYDLLLHYVLHYLNKDLTEKK